MSRNSNTVAPSRKIKVVFAINDFIIGGAQKLLIDVLTRLDRTRFEPELITLFQLNGGEHEYMYGALPKDVPVHKLHFKGFYDLGAWRTLIRTLRASRPDVVLSNLFFSNAVFRILAPFFRYRVIVVEHNTYTMKTRMHQLLDRLLAQVTYRIVAVSQTVATFTAAQEKINTDTFTVIYNGIDIKKLEREARESDPIETRRTLGVSPEERVIINVARVVPQKNHRLLLEGFALFAGSHPRYKLLIVGGGNALEKMKQYAAELGLTSRVQFLGYRTDVPRLLGISVFFVSTSLIEGFSIAHVEALACGVPVLTTKTAGSDEMIEEGMNGFFISSYTKEAVADGMEKMVWQDPLSMRAHARRSAQRYSIERAVEGYENLFEAALGRAGAGR